MRIRRRGIVRIELRETLAFGMDSLRNGGDGIQSPRA